MEDPHSDEPQLYDPDAPPFSAPATERNQDARKTTPFHQQLGSFKNTARRIDAGCALTATLFLIPKLLSELFGTGSHLVPTTIVGALAVGLAALLFGNGAVSEPLARWLFDVPKDR